MNISAASLGRIKQEWNKVVSSFSRCSKNHIHRLNSTGDNTEILHNLATNELPQLERAVSLFKTVLSTEISASTSSSSSHTSTPEETQSSDSHTSASKGSGKRNLLIRLITVQTQKKLIFLQLHLKDNVINLGLR